jgi:hypothetical protein
MKYVGDRPFATPEGAARKLLEIVRAKDIGVGQYAYTPRENGHRYRWPRSEAQPDRSKPEAPDRLSVAGVDPFAKR